MGYRGYDRNGTEPKYPFGYGLSYSTFEYSDLSVEEKDGNVLVSFTVRNTGRVDAKETVQVYVRDNECSVPRPDKELKGFDKLFIRKGESVRAQVTLGPDAFTFYDVSTHGFVLEEGTFTILAGPSSAQLPLSCTLNRHP